MPPRNSSDGNDGPFRITTDDFGSTEIQIDTEEMRRRMRELHFSNNPSLSDQTLTVSASATGDINRGNPITFMDTPSIEYWVVDEALNRESLDNVTRAACGERYDDVEGAAAVARLMVESASQEITERAYNNDFVQPFNEVTSGWPREARAILIQYEYESADRPECDYTDDLERFTSEGDGPNIPEVGTGTVPSLEVLSDLSPTLRGTALLLYADGAEIPADGFESISNHRRFRELYESCENVEDALRAESLDTRLPIQVAIQVDAPEDWPDDLEPNSVQQVTCIRCGTSYNEVSIHGEPTFVSQNGEPIDITRAGSGEPYRFVNGPPGNGGCICDSCETEFEAQSFTVAYIDPETDAHVLTERAGDLIYDLGHEDDSDYTPQDTLPPNVVERIDNTTRIDDFFQISPNSDFGDVSRQREAIAMLAEEQDQLSTGPVIVRLGGSDGSVYVERTNFDAACEVKETIEEHVNNV